MAANNVPGVPGPGVPPDEDRPEVFLCTGLSDGRNAQISPELEALAPRALAQPSQPLANFEQFRALWTAFYATLVVKAHPTQNNVNIVSTSFGSLTEDQLQPIRGSAPALAGVSRSPPGLYMTLRLLKQYDFLRTRNNLTALTALMSNDPINVALGVSLAQAGDDDTQVGFHVNMYLRLITHMLNSISHVHSKVRAGLEAYIWFQAAQKNLTDLKLETQDMLLALKSRSAANETAQAVGSCRQNCILSLREFTAGVDQIHSSNALLYLNSLQIHNVFSFTQGPHSLANLVTAGSIWAHCFNIPNIDVSAIDELKELGEGLDPLLDKIRSYQPSRVDDARDQAKNLKPSIIKLMDQIDIFFQSEEKSRGTAKSIILQIDGLRSQLQKLQCDGLILNADSIGSDQLTLETHYAKLTDFLSSVDQQQRLEETQRKLELQELSKASSNVQLKLRPLTGLSTWLQFNSSMEEILQVHQSSLVKAQMIRNALKCPEDQISCRDLNYEEIVSWLQNKYSDSSLLPKLCDELLLLPPANDNFKVSYENLNTFFTTVHHLKKFDALERLEKSYRDKLVPILLHEIHQAAFLAKRLEKELEWKQQLSPDIVLPEDDQSVATESHDPVLESRRLAFFIAQMKFFLPQAHQLSKTQKIKKNPAPVSVPRSSRNRTPYRQSDQHQTHQCPVCLVPHIDSKGITLVSLSRCQKFKTSLDVHARIAVVKKHGYCKRCLRPKYENDGLHDTGLCKYAQDKDLVCRNHDPPSPTHHYLLCLSGPDGQSVSHDQGQRGGGRGGGRGRGGPRGRGRGSQGRGGSTSNNAIGQTPAPGTVPGVETLQFSSSPFPSLTNIIPRLICNKSKSHQYLNVKIDYSKTRAFLSSACLIMALSFGSNVSLLSMMDSGSGMGFLSARAIDLLRPEPAKPWTGEIATLGQNKVGTWNTYIVNIIDIFNQIHSVRLIATDKIGFKDAIPSKIFNNICKSFNLSPNAVQNCSGEFDLLLGTDSFLLHGDKDPSLRSNRFPDICLMSSILSPIPYFVGSIGVRLSDNQNAVTMSFSIQSRQAKEANWFPTSAQLLLNRNYIKSYFVTSWFSNFLVGDNDEFCNKRNSSVTMCHKAHMAHIMSCSKRYVCYETKKTAATIDMELSQPAPPVMCEQCHQIYLHCQTCKYISQSISLKDLEELNILRQCIRVEKQPDGRSKIFVSYPQRKDPNIIFSASNSNHRGAKQSSIRLRQTLKRRGLLIPFHQMMQKTIDDNHCEEIEFDPNASPVNYVCLNYQEKEDSVSQPLRPISNSSFPNRSGESLNSNSLSGPAWLGSGLKCLISFRENFIGYHSDISKFYRSVYTDEQTNNLRRFFWFSNPEDETSLKLWKYTRGNYGDTSISILTEIIVREIIAKSCETKEVSRACNEQRIVDDFCSSVPDLQTALKVKHDLINTFAKFYFKIKHFHFSRMELDPDQESRVSVLGLQWSIPEDQLYVKTELYPDKKRRGRHVGPKLSPDTVKNLMITKEVLARLSGTLFCYSGAFLAPVQAALRISYSRLCQVTQSWSAPCHIIDSDLDTEIRNMLTNICDLSERIKPFPRCVSAPGFVPFRIIGCSDGAKHGLGFCYHLLSKSDDDFMSNIILARPSVHKLSIPASELCGLTKCVKSLDEIWSALNVWRDHDIELVYLTDSTCTAASLSLTRTFSDVRQRNSNITIHRIFSELVQNKPNVIIKVAHCSGRSMPADYLTRLAPDPVSLINDPLYRHGHPSWGNKVWPSKENIYLIYSNGKPPQFFSAIPEQHSSNNCVRCCESSSQSLSLMQKEETIVQNPTQNVDYIPWLSEDFYDYIFTRFSKLTQVINVLTFVFSWTPKRKNWTKLHLNKFVFRVIVKTHQKIFGPPRQIKSMMPYFDQQGIFTVTTRLDSQTGELMNINILTPIINKADTKFVNMIILHNHCQISSLTAKLHLGTTLTTAQIPSGPYAVYFPAMKATVQAYISNCGICNLINGQPQTPELGVPRFLKYLKNNDFAFKYLSIDDLGPWTKRTHVSSRVRVKFWILIIVDLLTGGTNLEIMEDRTRASVHKALYNHCTTYNTEPYHVYSDGASWISPDPSSPDFKKYFKTQFMVTKYKCSHQFLNKSERFTKMYKKLLRSVLLERERVKIPSLTYTEIRCLLGAIKACINSRPIFSSGSSNYILTPNHFLHPNSHFDEAAVKLPDSNNPESIDNFFFLTKNLEENLKILGDSLKVSHSFFIGVLKQLFVLDSPKSQQHKYKFIFQKNDIVLIIKSDKFCRGIIIEPGKQFSSVRSAAMSHDQDPENIHNSRLILLYRVAASDESAASEQLSHTNSNLLRFSSGHINVQIKI